MVVEPLDEPWSEVDDARLAAAAAFFDLPDTGPDDLPPWPEDDRAQSVAGILTLVDRLGPCSDAVMLLESLTGRELTEAQWLAVIVVWRSLLPWAEGLHLAAVAAFAGDAPPCGVSAQGNARGDDLDLAAAELGMALGVGREVALGLVHDARTLYGRCQPPGGDAALMTEANDADSLADGDDADTADSECDTADVDDDHGDDGGTDEGTSTGAAAKAAPVGPGGEGLLASTGQALLAGRLDSRRARLLVQQLGILDAEQARLAETALLPNAMRGSLSDLRRRIRYRLDKLNPDAALQRWAEARRKRSVSLDTEGDDGLVGLHAYLPPTEGLAVMGRLEQLAGRYHQEDGRSKDERLADALVGCVLGFVQPPCCGPCIGGDAVCGTSSTGAGSPGSGAPGASLRHKNGCPTPVPAPPPVTVQVLVDLPTLLGLRDNPGHLIGFGSLPADVARELAGDAAWQRLVHDPVTGHLIDVGHAQYRPGPRLAAFVRARDVRCRFPGCTRKARRADLDHTLPYDHFDPPRGGTTSAANLAALCRHHHRIKTHADITVSNDGEGGLTWTTRHGNTHTTEPHDDRPDADTDPPGRVGRCRPGAEYLAVLVVVAARALRHHVTVAVDDRARQHRGPYRPLV